MSNLQGNGFVLQLPLRCVVAAGGLLLREELVGGMQEAELSSLKGHFCVQVHVCKKVLAIESSTILEFKLIPVCW